MITRRSLLTAFAPAARPEDGFLTEEFAAWGTTKRVFKIIKNGAPAILFLHELPGLVPESFTLAGRLHQAGFSVYLPLFFGKPGKSSKWNYLACLGSQFDCNAWHSSGQIVNWIVSYAAELGRRHTKIGVIGNCLTGAVPLALMATGESRRFVKCAVLSQPSLPARPRTLADKEALGLTEEQVRDAVRSRIPVLAFRFKTDTIVPEERMRALERHFAGRPFHWEPVEPNPPECDPPGKQHAHAQHSVLTAGYCKLPDSPGRKAYQMLEKFLHEHLLKSTEASS